MENRDIRFRGKALDGGRWVEGSLKLGEWKYEPEPRYDEEASTIVGPYLDVQIDVDPNTVCQFTGLFDQQGNEIYEGDLLCGYHVGCPKEGENVRYRVLFLAGNYKCLRVGEFEYHDSRDYCNLSEVACVVIGNKYDNPELLEDAS